MAEPPKLLGAGRTRLIVFIAAAVLLIAGAWFRPHRDAGAPAPAAEATATPMLPSLVQEREPIRIFRALRARASEVAAQVVRLQCPGPSPSPAVPDWAAALPVEKPLPDFAVLIAPGELLADARARTDGCAAAFSDGRTETLGAPAAVGRQAALFEISADDSARAPLSAPQPGQLVFVTGDAPAGRIISPVFVVAATAGSLELSARPAAVRSGPLFDADGRVTGFLFGDGRARPIAAAINDARAPEAVAEPRSLGIAVQRITVHLRSFFGERGVIVADVYGPRSRESEGGFEPGDVILAIDGIAVDSPEAVAAALARTTAPSVTVNSVRGGRERTATVATRRASAPPPATTEPPATQDVVVLPMDALTVARQARRRRATAELVYLEQGGVRYFSTRERAP